MYFPDEVFSNILAYCGETYEAKRNRLWSYIKPSYEELMDEGVCPKIIKVSIISIQKGATLIDNDHHLYNTANQHHIYREYIIEGAYHRYRLEYEYYIDDDDRKELSLNPEIIYRPNWDGNWGYYYQNDRLRNWQHVHHIYSEIIS